MLAIISAHVDPVPDSDGCILSALPSPITLTVNLNTFSPAEANS